MKRIRVNRLVDMEEQDEYMRIEKWLLDVGDVLEFDLYKHADHSDEKLLFLEKEHLLSTTVRQMMDGIEHIYIRACDLDAYHRFIDSVVQSVALNTKISITKKAAVIYRQASIVLDEMFHNPEALENVPKSKKVVDGFVTTIFSDAHAIESLIKITSYDYYTHTHSINVCVYSLSLGSYLGLKPKRLEELGVSALLHDLGKSKIDYAITNKNGHLSVDEFEQMKLHPSYGHAIALKIGIKVIRILDGIRHHHEKLDGSGYPDKIRGKQITLFPRIIGVCDVFDALSTKRPYKERLSSYESLRLMKDTMEDHLDMTIVDAFIKMQRHDEILER